MRRSVLAVALSCAAVAGCGDGSDGEDEGAADLRPADEVVAERNLVGAIGGEPVVIDVGNSDVLAVAVLAVESLPRCEQGPGGLQACFEDPLAAVTVRIENRGDVDSDGVGWSLRCGGGPTAVPATDQSTVPAYGQSVPVGSFVEGVVVLSRPDSCPDAAITATPPVSFGAEGAATARWLLG